VDPVNLFECEALARAKLSRMAFDYYASGACDEITLRENRAAFDRIALHHRVLVDVSSRDLSTTVLGQKVSLPVLIAPTAFHGLAHPEGELATTRAAGAAGTIIVVSTLSNRTIEEVVAAASGPVWFQLYVYKDRGATRELIQRASASGCSALVLTVDAPVLGWRECDVRNQFQLPDGLVARNLESIGLGELPHDGRDSRLAGYFASHLDPSLSWRDVDWIRSLSPLPLVLKGVDHAEDAKLALEHDVAGIIVSNHGGRQLDSSRASIDSLRDVVVAVDGRVEVLMDGGVRRGTDVVKALALGARAVLIGRPALWGLAIDGEHGVRRVLDILRNELDIAMAICGCPTIEQITRDLIA
jgi:4-hydroxymandelate oxidase